MVAMNAGERDRAQVVWWVRCWLQYSTTAAAAYYSQPITWTRVGSMSDPRNRPDTVRLA
jgi:hypothetical protein